MRSLILLSLIAFGCDSTSEWCPPETTETGDGPPRGLEVVCKKENAAGDLVAHGPKIQWYMSGKKRTETAYVDGLETGTRREYGKQEQLTAETPYSGGAANGKRVEFFADGRKSRETTYVKGKQHGPQTAYYPNGNQRTRLLYRDDKQVGETQRWHDNGLPVGKIEWVRLEGGKYQMGHVDARGNRPRKVSVSPFYLSRTEVTVEQYRKCVDARACIAPRTGSVCNWGLSGRAAHPVNCVSWDQADAFAKWAKARLPTQEEWEYAARSGGKTQDYPWGNAPATCAFAVLHEKDDGCGQNRTWRACSKERGVSQQGICDLAGNVSEWVSTKKKKYRVFRGGSWNSVARQLRVYVQRAAQPKSQTPILGFRVARDVQAATK
jgi:antitoxin component YwqK of YwqJK toxin-antitoxin module